MCERGREGERARKDKGETQTGREKTNTQKVMNKQTGEKTKQQSNRMAG